ncbi:hypothetical protein KFL_012720030 [Klebsormidium nitens]|uniref:Sulfotransferase n=1 Tax=Klebsormidium nitens TaxID=105231 RepID=A0A1Y1ISM9_KLENI|nr:hypothetical protein KFL_012720030 [Klebsormidium nitens]|eukprot:GAQ93052.1 hypothetical protein KFL_012720030 [Klebsormidium nitens]
MAERIRRSSGRLVDWPGCRYWRELCDLHPDAKVILSVRDFNSWYRSAQTTIYAHNNAVLLKFKRFPWLKLAQKQKYLQRRTISDILWSKTGTFEGSFDNKEAARTIFERHVAQERLKTSALPGPRRTRCLRSILAASKKLKLLRDAGKAPDEYDARLQPPVNSFFPAATKKPESGTAEQRKDRAPTKKDRGIVDLIQPPKDPKRGPRGAPQGQAERLQRPQRHFPRPADVSFKLTAVEVPRGMKSQENGECDVN